MNTNFHTESRMRENCTYGSMRGRAFPTGRPALLLLVLPMVQRREGFVRVDGQNGGMGRRPLRVLRFMVNSGRKAFLIKT